MRNALSLLLVFYHKSSYRPGLIGGVVRLAAPLHEVFVPCETSYESPHAYAGFHEALICHVIRKKRG